MEEGLNGFWMVVSGLIGVAGGSGCVAFFKFLSNKSKDGKEIELAQLNIKASDFIKLQDQVLKLTKNAKLKEIELEKEKVQKQGYLDTMEIALVRVTTIQRAFQIFSPFLKKSIQTSPEGIQAYNEFEKLINEDYVDLDKHT